MRIGIAAGLLTALVMLPVAAQEGVKPRPASRLSTVCTGEARQDRLDGITAEGDLVLGSERLARLAGIRLADDQAHRQQALEWLKARAGESLLVTAQGTRDRWGRQPLKARTGYLDLSHGLVEAGLAIVDPGADSTFCQPELLALEETARERRLGLWAEARYNPIPVDQADRLKERVGSFVIVEGRVRSIGERKQRIYLNFGGQWADDFTIIVPRRIWALMAERGLSAETLKGHIIRARGILQPWQGTALNVDLPEMIERLEGGNLQGRKRDDKRLAR
ncbi:thermonuclease family protein [Microvirga solisilvae]|uniref:thermonuclease family protein n=1 Tax=Microvirga solisilvae TaxID=2919498 RepID=UPI001FAF1774|nr:thermonuclease family protein [Microvirga solisilvae]